MSPIYSLPIELLQKVLNQASMHDQRAACALSLVSRCISTAYAPFRFRMVAVSGERKITALLAALDAASPTDARIERLFLCDRVREETEDYFDIWDSGCIEDPETEEHNEEVEERNHESAERLAPIITRILQHAAPSARAVCLLSFIPEFTSLFGCLIGLFLPALSYLAIRPSRAVDPDCFPPRSVSLPVLRALVLPDLSRRWQCSWAMTYGLIEAVMGGVGAPLAQLTLVDVDATPNKLAFAKSALAPTHDEDKDGQDKAHAAVRGRVQRLEMRPIKEYERMWDDWSTGPSTKELYGLSGGWDGRLVVADTAERATYDAWRAEWRDEQ